MIDIADLGSGSSDEEQARQQAGWQPLPTRARALFMLSSALGTGITLLLVATISGSIALSRDRPELLAAAAGAWLALTLFSVWMGYKRWRFTHWRLDAHGFGLQRGRFWRNETRVPGSRVQHIDIQRGPLERQFGLSTLIVHTAGTRNSAVAVPGLDAGDAERLRDHLAQWVEHEDDDV